MQMPIYEHTQSGTLLRTIFSVTILLLGGGFFLLGVATGDRAALWVSLLTALLLSVALLLFHSLTVQVSPDEVVLRFGIGLIKKRFAMIDMLNSRIVQNRWFYGWGIRLTPQGWLYNVSGWDAVELELKNGRKARIGTDDVNGLQSAIASMIARTS